MASVNEIVTEDKSSGRFHRRYVVSKGDFAPTEPMADVERILVDERCNTDQSGDYKVLPQAGFSRAIDNRGVYVGTDQKMLCKFCWPQSE